MRNAIILSLALALGAGGLPATAHGLHIGHDECGFRTDYDVRADDAGLAFSRAAGRPAEVLMHDGRLRVDGRDVAVSAADAARLRQYEDEVRALLPEMAGIAREGIDLGFDAMGTVVATFARSDGERARLVERLNARHREALAGLDRGLGHGVWKQHELDTAIGQGIEDAVRELVGSVTADAVKAALSGDESQAQALEARADSLDKSIDQAVDARADKLERRAEALCPRLSALEQLQRQFRFRLPDGSPLRLVAREEAADREVVRR
jgi:hypothetical protein